MEQRYYKTVVGNLTLREWQRWKPGAGGFAGWLATRVIPIKAGDVGLYLPVRFADIQATQQELSPRAVSLLMPLLAEYEACGFRLASFVKMAHNLNLQWLDGGGCWLLHASGHYTGFIIYTLVASSNPGAEPVENIALYILCRLKSQHLFGATNTQNRFDSLPGTTALYINSPRPADLYTQLQQKVQPLWSRSAGGRFHFGRDGRFFRCVW